MPPLDAEEAEILELVELGEWQPVPNIAQAIERYQRYAQVQIDGLKSITISLPFSDLHRLEAFAQQSGI